MAEFDCGIVAGVAYCLAVIVVILMLVILFASAPSTQSTPLTDAAVVWFNDPSPANTDRLAGVVGAMMTLGIIVPAGDVVAQIYHTHKATPE